MKYDTMRTLLAANLVALALLLNACSDNASGIAQVDAASEMAQANAGGGWLTQ